jgi:hypothetical protein
MRLSNRLYGSRFAKWTIILFAIALLSLSLVNSKTRDHAFNPNMEVQISFVN